jgi:maltooligosyltrehalose trehalohydrolase
MAVREGRCREFAAFGWEPEAVPDPNRFETFHASKLHWDELSETDHQEMLAWYKSLIALRRSLSALTTGRLDLTNALFDAEHGWLCLERGPVRVVCNFSRKTIEIPCTPDKDYSVLLSSKPDCSMQETLIRMSPESAAIFAPVSLGDCRKDDPSTFSKSSRGRPSLFGT